MAYKMIPVDQETYDMLLELCTAYERKQGAHVKVLVSADYQKLMESKFLPKGKSKKVEKKGLAEQDTPEK